MSENKEKDKRVLLLYSTPGCHLCDLAKSLVDKTLLSEQLTLNIIDIANDDDLFEKYGISIPVIQFADTQQELFWPFDMEALELFLTRSSPA